MRYLANIISISRIVFSVSLIFFINNVIIFMVIYIFCGISDVLDGFIARKTKSKSTIGARLDSVADIFMFGIITISVVIWAGDELKKLVPFIISIVLIRLIYLIASLYKYHTFAMIHTWGNKLIGVLVYLIPVLFIVS